MREGYLKREIRDIYCYEGGRKRETERQRDTKKYRGRYRESERETDRQRVIERAKKR